MRAIRPQRFFDLGFEDFGRDPIDSVRRIYERFNLALDEHTLAAMLTWVADNGKEAHRKTGGHRYKPGDFDLDVAALRERFSYYDTWCC